MKLEGRSILAYFRDRTTAEKAADDLRKAGYQDLQISNFSRYPGGSHGESPGLSLSGDIGSLASLTMEAAGDDDEHILMAADPAAQGMAGTTHVQSRSWLLTIVTDDEHAEEVLSTLRHHGARI